MRYAICLLLSLLLFSCSSSKKTVTSAPAIKEATVPKVPSTTIKENFNTYISAIINKDFEKSMDYIAPEFFDIFPRATMVQVMEQTFNNPEIEFDLKDPKIISVGSPKKIAGKFYAPLRYSNMMNMKFVMTEEEAPEDKELRIELTRASLNQSFGAENLSYNAETEFFNIYSEKDVIAISMNGIDNWKFLVKEEKQLPILKQLVPAEVLEMK